MKRIGFSGTLDPITNGHLWVIGEARSMADEVLVFLSQNPVKQSQFPAEERKKIIEQSAAERGWDNVQVIIVKSDYTARVAKKHGADYLIRGIRTTADFDYENLIQQTNVDVLGGAKTIFVMPPRDLGSVSSSFVKALEGPVGWNWTMKKFVPGPAYRAWILNWLRKEWETLWQYRNGSVAQVAIAERWFAHLTGPQAYGGAGRRYHNLDHLVHGLAEIRAWAANTDSAADSIKKAFWFYHAVHQHDDAGLLSGAEASARLWLSSGLDADSNGAVAELIRSNDAVQGPAHPQKDVMLSIERAILGQNEEIYDAYMAAIRGEYAHVAEADFRQQRRHALLQLRAKAQADILFGERYFAEQYNASAIENMTREIGLLGTP